MLKKSSMEWLIRPMKLIKNKILIFQKSKESYLFVAMQDNTNKSRHVGHHKGTDLSKTPNLIDKTRDPRRKPVTLDPFAPPTVKVIKAENHWNKLPAFHRLQIASFLRDRCLGFLSISSEVYEKKSKAEKDELEVYIMEMVTQTRHKICDRFNRNLGNDYFSGFSGKRIEQFADIPKAYWENVLNERMLRSKKLDFLVESIRQSPVNRPPVISYSMETESKIVSVTKMEIRKSETILFVSEKYFRSYIKRLIKDCVSQVLEIDLSKDWHLSKCIVADQNTEDAEGLSVIQFSYEDFLRNGNTVGVTFPNGLKLGGYYLSYDRYYIPFELSIIGTIFKQDKKWYIKVSKIHGIKR